MTYEASATFIAALLVMVYINPMVLKRVSIIAIVIAAFYFTQDLAVAILPTLFAIVGGCAINAWSKMHQQFYLDECAKEYNLILRNLPDFVEVPLERKNEYCFIIKEGDYACKVFHVKRVGKEDAECIYADLTDEELVSLERDEGAVALMEDLFTMVVLRKELDLEDA